MNTIGIICLSLLAGTVIALILGGGVFLGVSLHRSRKDQSIFAEKLKIMLDTHAGEFDATAGSMKAELESLRGVVNGTRTEQRKAQETFVVEVRETLSKHREEMGLLVSRINGEALTAAAANIVRASKQLTEVASMVQQLVLSQDEDMDTRRMAPEETAPEGHSFYDQSPIAKQDFLDEQEQLDLTETP